MHKSAPVLELIIMFCAWILPAVAINYGIKWHVARRLAGWQQTYCTVKECRASRRSTLLTLKYNFEGREYSPRITFFNFIIPQNDRMLWKAPDNGHTLYVNPQQPTRCLLQEQLDAGGLDAPSLLFKKMITCIVLSLAAIILTACWLVSESYQANTFLLSLFPIIPMACCGLQDTTDVRWQCFSFSIRGRMLNSRNDEIMP